MNIVVDMNLSPEWIPLLNNSGLKAKHWHEIGAANAPDTEIMEWARTNGYIVFTHDLDFGALLFATNARSPSVIQIRAEDVRPNVAGSLVLNAIQSMITQLEQGALVVVDPKKSRIRYLPLNREINP